MTLKRLPQLTNEEHYQVEIMIGSRQRGEEDFVGQIEKGLSPYCRLVERPRKGPKVVGGRAFWRDWSGKVESEEGGKMVIGIRQHYYQPGSILDKAEAVLRYSAGFTSEDLDIVRGVVLATGLGSGKEK